MAAQTCVHSQTATLTGTTADSITFSGTGGKLMVTNHHATELLFFRFDGTTAVGSADENYVCRPGQTVELEGHWGRPVLSVVGNANPYTVSIF